MAVKKIANEKSREIFARACRALPGGVSSPVRAFRAVGGTPPVIARAEGAGIEDVDGNRYLDFVCSWGPLILGHAHEAVIDAVTEAVRRGSSFGAPCENEVALAEKVIGLYPALEQVRFVSSGTEATMSAIRLARGATGRNLIVKFSGCYHGHADHLLVAAGSGLATFGRPASHGVPEAFAELTRVVPLDDLARLEALFAEEGEQIAAVIIEPAPANNGLLLARDGYLEALRRITKEHGALLIFDEVITGFRVAPGGMCELSGVVPDLATFGKVIGGGLPVGAFGGSSEIMKHLAPEGGVYQAGTLSGNPVAMAAGLAVLTHLERNDGWRRLDQLGAEVEKRLLPVLEKAPFPITLVRIGSIFWMALDSSEPPRSAETIAANAGELYRPLFHSLLARGVSLAPSAFEVGFVSLAHVEEHFDRLASALDSALAEHPAGS